METTANIRTGAMPPRACARKKRTGTKQKTAAGEKLQMRIAVPDDPVNRVDQYVQLLFGGLGLGAPLGIIAFVPFPVLLDRIQDGPGDYDQAADRFVVF